MKTKIIISLIIMFIFSFAGFIMVGAFVHENIHRFDFRNVTKLTEDICYLNSNIEANYNYVIPADQKEIADEISSKTEFRASGSTAIILLVYAFTFGISLKYISGKGDEE